MPKKFQEYRTFPTNFQQRYLNIGTRLSQTEPLVMTTSIFCPIFTRSVSLNYNIFLISIDGLDSCFHHCLVHCFPASCIRVSDSQILNHSPRNFQKSLFLSILDIWRQVSTYFSTLIPNHPAWRRVKMQPWGVMGEKLLFRWSRDQCSTKRK